MGEPEIRENYCAGCPALKREYDRRCGTDYRCGRNGWVLCHNKGEYTAAGDTILKPKWCDRVQA